MATKKINNNFKRMTKNDSKSLRVSVETPKMLNQSGTAKRKNIILPVLLLVILILGLLAYLLKNRYLAAIVNKKPIFRSQLNSKLSSSYGKETLENMIIEQLIREEAKKKSVLITKEDIDKEMEKISASLGGGMKLEDVLKFQGISLDEFIKQLETKLQVNKILENEVTVTSEEVNQYLKDNAKTIIATNEAERKTEAELKIKEQKIADKIQQWVTDLLSNAKIQRFLQ